MHKKLILCGFLGMAGALMAAGPADIFDKQLSNAEREMVGLADKMPADKFSFVPTQGKFDGVRTFGQLVTHLATVQNMASAALLGEKPPSDTGKELNGPASIKTKEEAVKYLKDSFANAHRALKTLTEQNLMEEVQGPFGPQKMSRLQIALIPMWHDYDTYGQMVEYGRMNGVVPVGSR